jgi:multiple sugar transport system substrate-binding protein
MAASEDRRATYCPFAYGYSNYSRPGYAKHVLHAGGLVKFNARRLRSTLGGAGIAVSARTSHPRAAMDYAIFTASPEVQRGIYFEAGGQPGHRSAWTDAGTNAASSNFFLQTLQTLDEAILRPKHPRYMEFQDAGSPIVHSAVSGKMSISEATEQLAELAKLLSVSAS